MNFTVLVSISFMNRETISFLAKEANCLSSVKTLFESLNTNNIDSILLITSKYFDFWDWDSLDPLPE